MMTSPVVKRYDSGGVRGNGNSGEREANPPIVKFVSNSPDPDGQCTLVQTEIHREYDSEIVLSQRQQKKAKLPEGSDGKSSPKFYHLISPQTKRI